MISENLDGELGRIREQAVALAPDLNGRLLVYAEADDGTVSASIFYASIRGTVRFRYCPFPIEDLIYSHWMVCADGSKKWSVMCMVVDGSCAQIEYVKPDQLIEDEYEFDRRPRAVAKYFGRADVDYSSP